MMPDYEKFRGAASRNGDRVIPNGKRRTVTLHEGVPSYLFDVPDSEVVQAAQNGCVGGIGILYERFHNTLIGYLRKRGIREPEEDIQTAFVRVLEKIGDYNPERGNVEGWVVTIARNASIDRIRSENRRRAKDIDSVKVEDPSFAHDPEVRAVNNDLRRELQELISSELTPEQQQVVVLHYFGELSLSRIAEFTESPLGTVKTRHRLALRKLRKAVIRKPGF